MKLLRRPPRLFTADNPPIRCVLLSLVWLLIGPEAALAAERYAGEAKIDTQPTFPIHLELQRSGNTVTGIVSIPGRRFMVEGRGGDTVVGRFRGDGGAGALTLHIKGDLLEGAFDLGGQTGTITAYRSSEDAEVHVPAAAATAGSYDGRVAPGS